MSSAATLSLGAESSCETLTRSNGAGVNGKKARTTLTLFNGSRRVRESDGLLNNNEKSKV